MKLRLFAPALAAAALVAGVGSAPAQNATPPGYLDRVRQYRSYNFGLNGGENVNVGTTRSISTFLPVNDTNGTTTVTYNPKTILVTTNSTGVTAPIGGTTGLTVTVTEDYPIRSMLVDVIFESTKPLEDLQIKLVHGTASVILKDFNTGTTKKFVAPPPGILGGLRFDESSLTDLGTLVDFTEFLAPVADTVKLAGGGNYSAFTNSSTRGDWTLSISTPGVTSSSNVLYYFLVTVSSDPQGVTINQNGKVYDLRPRIISQQNFTAFDSDGNQITLIPRALSEQ